MDGLIKQGEARCSYDLPSQESCEWMDEAFELRDALRDTAADRLWLAGQLAHSGVKLMCIGRGCCRLNDGPCPGTRGDTDRTLHIPCWLAFAAAQRKGAA